MLNIWEFVEDVETPDSLLGYVLSATNDSLITVFDSTKGDLLLFKHEIGLANRNFYEMGARTISMISPKTFPTESWITRFAS